MMDSERLIEVVENCQCIWNTSLQEYRNQNLKDASWNSVCQDLVEDWISLSGEEKTIKLNEIKTRWTNITDYYKKEIDQQRNVWTGQLAKKQKKYVFADILKFLRPVFEQRDGSNKCDDTKQETQSDTVVITTTTAISPINSITPTNALMTSRTTASPPCQVFHKTKKPSVELNSLESRIVKTLEKKITPFTPAPAPAPDDPDLLYLKTLLPGLKSLTGNQKLVFKIRVIELLKTIKDSSPQLEKLTLPEILCLAVAVDKKRNSKKTKEKRFWVHPFYGNRLTEGVFHRSYPKIRSFPDKFYEYYRMSVTSFDELKCLVRDKIKKETVVRRPIGVEERLTVTLYYLATGLNFTAMSHNFHIAKQTIRVIVKETCEAIWDVLQPREMAPPSAGEWKNISRQFLSKTQFPNCVGVVDGKHIRLGCPEVKKSFFSKTKKHYNSIVLLAVVDAEYRFSAINVRPYVKEGDSAILQESTFRKMLFNNQLDIPEPEKLPNAETNELLPFVFLGDEAFALHKHILRPYPKRNLSVPKKVFNCRLSRARRYVECAFGILTNKWRVFYSSMLLQPDFAVKVTKAACVLHNFVRVRDGFNFEDTLSYSFGKGDDDLNFGRHFYSQNSIAIREKYAEYFISASGEVSWQYKRAKM